MYKKIFFIYTNAALLYSCGSKSASNTSNGTTSSNFANPGPSSCLASSSTSSQEMESPYYENFREALSTPFQMNLSRQYLEIPNQQEVEYNKNLQIVNGGTVLVSDGSNTNCQSATNSPSAKTIATNNTVGIRFPASGLVGTSGNDVVCSGALVGTGTSYLVLTAAHCFNQIADYTSKTAGGAKIFFDNNVSSSNYSTVSCWQRNPNYRAPSTSDTDVTKNLFDIAWLKLPSSFNPSSFGYAIAPVLANPTQITPTSEKLMVGFGATDDGQTAGTAGLKRCVTTTSASIDPNYAARGDIIPAGAVASFDALATSTLGTSLVGTSAFETYLTVIGPINGGSSVSVGTASNASESYNYPNGALFSSTAKSSGTCFGDSGGPVYINSSGWVIAALTEGSDSLLTPHPIVDFTASATSTGLNAASNFNSTYASLCEDGYGTYTTIGNYISWIRSSSGITINSQ